MPPGEEKGPTKSWKMPDSKPPITQEFRHQEVMRSKYNDPIKLRTSLDDIYGAGNYKVKVISNRYILMLPTPMKKGQMEEIEQKIRSHYNN